MRRECRERFPPPPISKETDSWRSRHASRHVRDARAVMHVGIAHLRWRGKRSRHSRRMRTRNFTYLARGLLLWHWIDRYMTAPVDVKNSPGKYPHFDDPPLNSEKRDTYMSEIHGTYNVIIQWSIWFNSSLKWDLISLYKIIVLIQWWIYIMKRLISEVPFYIPSMLLCSVSISVMARPWLSTLLWASWPKYIHVGDPGKTYLLPHPVAQAATSRPILPPIGTNPLYRTHRLHSQMLRTTLIYRLSRRKYATFHLAGVHVFKTCLKWILLTH